MKKIARRLSKPTYKHLTKDEATYHKALVEKDRLEKELYGTRGFYTYFPKKNGAINWEAISKEDIEIFEAVNKKFEKINKRISALENLYQVIVLVTVIAPFLFCFFIVLDIHILINNYIGINNFFIESDSQSNSILSFVILLVFCFLLLFILDAMLNYNKMRLFFIYFNEGKEFF